MTFRHSFYISITIHLLIFGSAISFAQFAGSMHLRSHDAVTVSLVSPGSTFKKGNRAASSHQFLPQQKNDQQVPTEQPSNVDMQNERTKNINGLSPKIEKAGNESGTASGGSVAVAQGTDGPQGALSHEEWAVLATAIDRSKSYPRLARERGIEGIVRLRFKLAASGVVDRIEIIESSGYEILDSASIRAVHRAEPLPYVRGWVEVPIAYVLK